MARTFRVKVTSEFTLTEEEMEILLKDNADRLLSIEDNDELEWRILDDEDAVRSIELIGAICHAMTKMQLAVKGAPDDEELDPEAVAAVAQEAQEAGEDESAGEGTGS